MDSLDEGGGSVRKRRVKDDSNVFGPATPSARVDLRGRLGLPHLLRTGTSGLQACEDLQHLPLTVTPCGCKGQ